MTPRLTAEGPGWSVFRQGRACCLKIGEAEIWLAREPNDIVRGSLLQSLVAGAYGKVNEVAALEALKASWTGKRQ